MKLTSVKKARTKNPVQGNCKVAKQIELKPLQTRPLEVNHIETVDMKVRTVEPKHEEVDDEQADNWWRKYIKH